VDILGSHSLFLRKGIPELYIEWRWPELRTSLTFGNGLPVLAICTDLVSETSALFLVLQAITTEIYRGSNLPKMCLQQNKLTHHRNPKQAKECCLTSPHGLKEHFLISPISVCLPPQPAYLCALEPKWSPWKLGGDPSEWELQWSARPQTKFLIVPCLLILLPKRMSE
jgi:hypothetical protein